MKHTIHYRNISHGIIALKKCKKIFSENGTSKFYKLDKIFFFKGKIELSFIEKDYIFCPVRATHFDLKSADNQILYDICKYKSAF